MANWCSSGARTEPAFISVSGVAPSMSQRPAVCRTFDCRVFAAMSLVERCGPSHETPGWEFAASEPKDFLLSV